MEKDELLNFTFEWELLEECPLCAEKVLVPSGKIRWLDMDFWYNFCVNCGLKFMDPRPTQQSYMDFYKNVFWEHKAKNLGFQMQGQVWNAQRPKSHNDEEWSKEEGKKAVMDKLKEVRFHVIRDTLLNHVALGANTDVLEVGAGFGVTLDELSKQHGCNVFAIEPSLEAQKTFQEMGITLLGDYAEDLEKLHVKEQKFDAIIFSHSLENTVDPLQIIKWAKACLKENGVIYVQCSNLYTFDQMNPYHPYIFSEQSLGFLARSVELTPVREGERLHRMLTMILKKS